METKFVEIRDDGTCIPAMAILVGDHHFPEGSPEAWLLGRSGFSGDDYVILIKLDPVTAQYDPYAWPSHRTMRVAHDWIRKNWRAMQSGQVVDVQFILGERPNPKTSDRIREIV